MQMTTLRSRLVLLLVGVLLFGGAAQRRPHSQLQGMADGGARHRLADRARRQALRWPSAGTRAFLNADGVGSPATYLVPGYSYGTK